MMVEPVSDEHIRRFNELPEYVRFFLDFPQIRRFILPLFPASLGVSLFLLAVAVGQVFLLLVSVLCGVYTVWYFKNYLKKLEPTDITGDGNKEPVFAQMILFGSRTPEIFDEGYYWLMPGASAEVRSKELFNRDITVPTTLFRLEPHPSGDSSSTFYKNVGAALRDPAPAEIKSGGQAEITIGITFERDWRDGHKVLDYDDAGETAGVSQIYTDMIEADLREVGKRLTWLQASFATDLISAHLIAKLTGKDTDSSGRKIFDDPTPESIEAFLTSVKVNGAPLIRGLGLKVRRLEVKSVNPVGKLAQAAEVAAVNQLKREGLLADTDALTAAVEKLAEKMDDGSMSKKDLINAIQVNEDGSRVEKRIVELAINGGFIKEILGALKGTST